MKFVKQIGGIRVRTFFALLPITVYTNNFRVTRWLETVTVEEMYETADFVEGDPPYWKPIKFLN